MRGPFSPRPLEPAAATPRQKATAWFWTLLAVAVGAAVALAALPALLPTLAASLSGTAPHAYWYISRASAFVAFTLLWISILAGLGITSLLGRFWPGLGASFELHRYTSFLGLGFGLAHALILLGDQYLNFTLAQLLVPFMSANYRPEWVGLGQVALYLLAVVAFSFYARDRLGVRAWRLIHALSFALFLAVLIHGLQSGTDSHNWWALALYGLSGASVLAAALYRVLAPRAGRPRQVLATTGLVTLGGKTQRPGEPPNQQ